MIKEQERERERDVRDKNPFQPFSKNRVSKFFFLFVQFFFFFLKLCTQAEADSIAVGSYSSSERVYANAGRGRVPRPPPSLLTDTHRSPRGSMPVSLLLSNLQEWKDRAPEEKEAYKYRRAEKQKREREICFRRNSNGSQEKNFYQMVLQDNINYSHTLGRPRSTPYAIERERERKDMQKFSHIQHHIAQQILTHLSLGRREKDNYRIIKEWRQVGGREGGNSKTTFYDIFFF